MKNIIFIKLSALLIVLFSYSASAIVIRHDVEDKQYIALGDQYSQSLAYIGGCAATLIAPQWILTAAHCLAGKENQLFFVRHLDNQYRLNKIFIHPKFVRSNDEVYDIALVQLKDPISNGNPVALYQANSELDLPVIFVGRGTYGNGKDGLIRDDFIQRGATNTVDKVTEHVLGFTFNSPPIATEFEGISSRGDSGGPAFIEQNTQLLVIGVSSYQVGNGHKEGHYGVAEFYTRVSTVYPWLQDTIESAPYAVIAQHPIIDAIKNNDTLALDNALDSRALSDQGVLQEAFYQSVILDRPNLAKPLILKGADVTKMTIHNASIFEFALSQKRKEYFKMLLQLTSDAADLHAKNSPVLALFINRFNDDPYLLEGVNLLIKQGVDLNAQTSSGDTPLIIAGWRTSNFSLLKRLIEKGADLDIANNNGDTPLMDAAYLGKVENLSYLLKSGADISLKNKSGKTALQLAQMKSHDHVAKILRTYQSQLNEGD